MTFLPLIGLVAAIRFASLAVAFVKVRQFLFLRTWGNRLTGVVIFFGLCGYLVFKTDLFIWVSLGIALLSALEELLIMILSKRPHKNIDHIFALRAG